MYFVIFSKLRQGLQFWRRKKDACPPDGEIFFSLATGNEGANTSNMRVQEDNAA